MASLYLQRLSDVERATLVKTLHELQHGNCFICEQPIDLEVHKNAIDIDHVVPLNAGGKDDQSNFALTHASCNRSKQAANLEVARILQRFSLLKETIASENRSPNLEDVLKKHGGATTALNFTLSEDVIRFALSAVSDERLREVPVYVDRLSGFRYFFANLPIQYLAHDSRINPRSIGNNIGKIVDEFYQKRPQLHVSLAWITSQNGTSAVHVFDGQHKAAAQVMLGIRTLPVRIFVDPDPDTLITTNTNAGTKLRQVAFDKSVQRHLGGTLYKDRIERFQRETGRQDDDLSFSEQELVSFFKGQSRELKRFVVDAVRDAVTSSSENKLRDFIDYGGRGKERPLSYSTIDKTFYSFFVYQGVLTTPLNYRAESGDNPRELETTQIIKLMNIVAEEIYIGKFNPDIGTDKIESRLQKGESFTHDHLRAFRMSKEEVIYNWLRYVQLVAKNYFLTIGRPIQEDKLFQYPIPDQLWTNVRNFVHNLSVLPLWVDKSLSETVFGGKQNYSFWQTVFESGRSPQGVLVLTKPINLVDMIQ